MQLSAIEAFVAVCEHGSVRAAAAAMHLTQPAISKRIATLEAQFGHELFGKRAPEWVPEYLNMTTGTPAAIINGTTLESPDMPNKWALYYCARRRG